MENKICPLCNNAVNKEALVCPQCGASLAAEETESKTVPSNEGTQDMHLTNEETDISFEEYNAETAENNEELVPVKSGKVVRFTAFFLAVVLLFFAAKFLWSNFGPGCEISVVTFDAKDAIGTYTDSVYGRYYTFKSDAKELASSTATSSAEEEVLSYDGTYETGFTKEYINGVLVNQYIIDNNLSEEYDAYLKEKNLIIDDYNGFAKKKKISKDELDAIDQEYQYVQMGESYKSNGLWKYDDKAEAIYIYDSTGNLLGTFFVKREGLVADTGFMAGRTGFGKTFNSSFVGKNYEYGITETINTYNDGMCISVISQDDGTNPVYIAGNYKVKDNVIVFYLNDDVMRYRKVTGGLGFMVYTK